MTHHRIDAAHSNIVAVWDQLRQDARWPDDTQWQLRGQGNTLAGAAPAARREPVDAELVFDSSLPMPAVSCLDLIREGPGGNF